jgi:hypothetical protein
MGSEGCSVQYVTGSNIPYTMNDPTMENLLRYTPPADKYGDAFAVFTLYVADQVNLHYHIYNISHIYIITFAIFPKFTLSYSQNYKNYAYSFKYQCTTKTLCGPLPLIQR